MHETGPRPATLSTEYGDLSLFPSRTTTHCQTDGAYKKQSHAGATIRASLEDLVFDA